MWGALPARRAGQHFPWPFSAVQTTESLYTPLLLSNYFISLCPLLCIPIPTFRSSLIFFFNDFYLFHYSWFTKFCQFSTVPSHTYTYTYTYIHTHTCTYTYTHIHIHIHIYILFCHIIIITLSCSILSVFRNRQSSQWFFVLFCFQRYKFQLSFLPVSG